jgi:Xaa-Pro aminopeptidase
MSKFKARIDKLSQFLNQDQALLLSLVTDITYLTSFNDLVPEEREAFLLITPDTNIFFHASFSPFKSPAGINSSKGCALSKITTALEKLHQKNNIKELLVDKSNLFVNEYEALAKLSFLKLAGFDRQHIWKLRTIKDEEEIKSLKKAATATSRAIAASIKSLKAGMTEIQLKIIIEAELQKAGSEKPAFPTIVAFGPNSALPHHQPTNTILEAEMPILIDLGATVDGYNGDMTRTVWFGKKPPAEFLKIEKIVKSAYQAAVDALNNRRDNQILAKELDQAARSTISQAGYAKKFIHTTGHGLGLDLHENLSLNWNNGQSILPNMVITIEPGIYLEGKFGYRYENMILVTDDEAQELTY